MDSDQGIHPIILKYAFARGTRGDALRHPDTRRAIDRLIALGATDPDNARAMQGLTPEEESALAWLRSKGLACEIAPDLWCLHPRAWDERYNLNLTVRQQAWIAVLAGTVAVVALWLQYFS